MSVRSLLSRVPNGLRWRLNRIRTLAPLKEIACQTHFRLGYPLPHGLRSFYHNNLVERLCPQYRLQPYCGEVILFQSETSLEGYWRKLCGSIKNVYTFQGGHAEIVKEPNVKILCAQFMDELLESQVRAEQRTQRSKPLDSNRWDSVTIP